MTFRQRHTHSPVSHAGFRLLTGGILAVLVAACAVSLPATVAGGPSALRTVQSTMAVGVGQEKDLLPFVRLATTGAVPFTPLTWEVSNPALLTVEPATGRARGLKAGTVVVQVKVPGDEASATQFFITVIGESAAVVKDVMVQPASHHMVVGEKIALKAQVFMPDGQVNANVFWASSDDTVAKVDRNEGIVNAVKPGRVTVMAQYAPFPEFKGLTDIFIYYSHAEIPASPEPVLPSPLPAPSVNPTPSEPPSLVHPVALTPASPQLQPAPVAVFFTPTPTPFAPAGADSLSPTPLFSAVPLPGTAPSLEPLVTSPSPSPTATPFISAFEFTVAHVAGSIFTGGNTLVDGPATSARFYFPAGVAVDSKGIIYVADQGNKAIRTISTLGIVSTLRFPVSLDGPYSVGIDVRDNLYVLDSSGNIYRLAADGTFTKLGKVMKSFGMAVDPITGDVYLPEYLNHRIVKLSASGLLTTIAGTSQGYVDGLTSEARFDGPSEIALDSARNIYVSEGSRIRKISVNGSVSTLAGSSNGGMSARGLVVDPNGIVYVVDTLNHRIRRITPEGEVTTVAGGAAGLTNGPGPVAQFYLPRGLAIDSGGRLYVADTQNCYIRVLNPVQ